MPLYYWAALSLSFRQISNVRGCTIKIKLLGFSKFLYHCFQESVSLFTVSNLLYLLGIISEFRLGAKIGDARLWEQKYV